MENYTKAAVLALVLCAGLWVCAVWQLIDLAAVLGFILLPTLYAMDHEARQSKRK